MKKLTFFLVALFLGLSAMAHDFEAVHNGKTIYYNITSSTAPRTVEVTFRGESYDAYDEYSGDIEIPETVSNGGNTYLVTAIGNEAFYFCTSVNSVIIGNSVIDIESYAFAYCVALNSVIFGNSVISIGSNAFLSCVSLTSVTIGNSVTVIGYRAFHVCSKLTSITFGNSLIVIENEAFHSCTSLTSVTIPNSVTYIGDYAFQTCSNMTSVSIPNSVVSIGIAAFSYCRNLQTVEVAWQTPLTVHETIFYQVEPINKVLKVPRFSIDLYRHADVWKDFHTIEAADCPTSGTIRNVGSTPTKP